MKAKMNLARGGDKASKKLLAAVVVLAVVLCAFAVFAPIADETDAAVKDTTVATIGETEYDSIDVAVNAAKDGETIVLQKDSTISTPISITKKLTVDFNEKTVTGPNDRPLFGVTSGGDLTVKGNGTTTGFGFASAIDGAKLTIDNGTFTGDEYGVLFYKNAVVTINGGTITGKDNAGVMSNGTSGWGGSKLTINGGTIIGQTVTSGYANCGLYLPNGETTVINGGTIKGTYGAAILLRGGSLTINDGVFEGHGDAGTDGKKMGDAIATYCGGIEIGFDAKYPAGIKSVTINGGTFTSEKSVAFAVLGEKTEDSKIAINGGTFGDDSYAEYSGNAVVTQIISADTDVTLSKDLKRNYIILAGATLSVNAGNYSYSGTITTQDADGKNSQSAVFSEAKGTFSISKGSVKLNGVDFTADSVTLGDDDVLTISGSVGDLEVKGTGSVSMDTNVSIASGLKIDNGVKMTIADGATLTVANGATLTVDGTVTGNIAGEGKIVVENGDISGATIGSKVTIEDKSDDSSKKTITWKDGEVDYYADGSKHVIGSNQIINIEGRVTLASNSILAIAGKLIVPAGAELIVQCDSTLEFVTGGSLIVEGTLIIEEKEEDAIGAGELKLDSAVADISGSLTVNGVFEIKGASKVYFKQDSSATIASGGKMKLIGGEVVVDDSAVLTVNGVLDAEPGIKNYGTVVIDSTDAWSSQVRIFMGVDGAVVDVKQVTFGSSGAFLEISDNRLLVYTDRDGTEYRINGSFGKVNNITLSAEGFTASGPTASVATVSAFTVVEKVSQKSYDSAPASTPYGYVDAAKKAYTNTMDLSGSLAVTSSLADDSATGTPAVNTATLRLNGEKGIIISSENFTVGGNTVLVNAYNLTVTGTVDAVTVGSTGVAKSVISNFAATEYAGKITLSGDGQIRSIDKIDGTINAARYETGSGTSKLNVYVTIDSALATVNQAGNTVKAVELLGSNTVKASATLPATVVLTMNGATLTVGEKAGSDVVLTIAKGATLKGTSKIDVKGTLYAENVKDVKNASIIESDVFSQQIDEKNKVVSDGWAQWTNLAAALNSDAKLITIYKSTGTVDIAADTTVKEGVTLVVPAGKANLNLKNGVTLTVAGTLKTSEPITAENKIDVKASTILGQESSAVVVTGYLMTPSGITYGDASESTAITAPIAGAYYAIKDWSVIAPIDKAVAAVKDIISEAITINGKVAGSDIAFAAGETCKKIVFGTEAEFAIKSLTLSDGAAFVLSADASFTGSVIVGDAEVDVIGGTGAFTFTEKDGKLLLSGSIAITDKGDSMVIARGTVVADGFSVASYSSALFNEYDTIFEVASGATLDVPKDGGFIVIPGTTPTYTSIVVNGVLNIANVNAGQLGMVTVYGALTVADATASAAAGSIQIAVLFVGTSLDDVYDDTAAAASVSGPVDTYAAIVKADASLSESTLESFKVGGKLISTTYVVEDKDWITVYQVDSTASVDINDINKVPVENAKFDEAWLDADGNEIRDGVAVGTFEKVFAKIDYNIYDVVLKADAGIENVAIDGNLMEYNAFSGEYKIDGLRSGSHTVTYTLKNGYTGNATLSVNGEKQSGLSFTVSGAPAQDDDAYVLQLSGVTASGYTPVSPVTPSEDKDDGLTITDYLLIVLVILIVIMAVIVAMRLMRS